MAHLMYTKELGQKQPAADGTASLSVWGTHYFVRTHLQLSGRGIVQEESGKYKVTLKAFEKLSQRYDFSTCIYLD